jgi:dienelactone hydrolase
MKHWLCALALSAFALAPATAQEHFPRDSAARIIVIPYTTRTVSDDAFRAGDKTAGQDSEIAGVLRLPLGSGPFPTVLLVEGSGGINSNDDYWSRDFLSHGIATFTIDGFTGRGIDTLIVDQSKLGLMNMIVDVYRGLGALAKNPLIDTKRIAVMGFSRGGLITLYAAMKRFQTAWNDSGVTPAAYIPFYPVCNFHFQDDESVEGSIRIFHGASDDYVPIAPCQDYVKRLKAAGKDAEITALPNAYHGFDVSTIPSSLFIEKAQMTNCILGEEKSGAMLNQATGKPWAPTDPCNGVGAHVGYSTEATTASEAEVVKFLTTKFNLGN